MIPMIPLDEEKVAPSLYLMSAFAAHSTCGRPGCCGVEVITRFAIATLGMRVTDDVALLVCVCKCDLGKRRCRYLICEKTRVREGTLLSNHGRRISCR